MAAKNEAKIRFSAETKDFDKGIKTANDTLSTLRNELKLNEAQMKNNGVSVDGLREKQKNLASQMEAAQDKTKALSDKLQVAVDVFGENSVEANKLRNQLINAQTAEVKLQGAIDRCNAELKRQEDAANRVKTESEKLTDTIDDQQNELDKLKDAYADYVVSGEESSREAKELARKIKELSGELKDNQEAMDRARNAADKLDESIEDAGESAEDAGDGFTVFKGACADLLSEGIQSLVSGLGDLVSNLGNVAEETKEYRTIMGSLENSSQLAGYSADETAETFKHLNGVLGDTQSSATTTANLQAIGLEQSKLQTLTNGLIGAWAKYGDSIPIDGLAEAVNETVKAGQVTGTFADVLNWGAKEGETFGVTLKEATEENEAWNQAVTDAASAEDFFNLALQECTTEAERANLIMQLLADQGLTEAGEAWQKTNEDIVKLNNAQATYEENTARLGEKMSPITTSIKEGFNGIFEEVLNLTEGVDFDAIGETIKGAFGWFVDEGIPAIVQGVKDVVSWLGEAKTWIEEHAGLLTGLAIAIGVVTAAITLQNTVNAIKAAMDAAQVTTIWGLVAAHLAQAAAAMAALAPYILIVAAIAAVIAIIVLCIMYWDEIVAAVKKAWEAIKETLAVWGKWIDENVIQPVAEFFSGLWDGITTGVKAAWDWIVGLFNTVTSWVYNNLIAPVGKFFTDLWNGIVDGVTSAWNWVVGLISSVRAWIYNNLIAPVVQFFVDLWNGIVNAFHTVIDPWIEIIRRASVLVYNEIIAPIMQFFTDLWNSIVAGIQAAWDWIVGLFNTITAWVYNNVTQPLQNFFIELWNSIVSGVQAAWDWVVGLAVTIATWINENVIQPSINFFTNLWNSIVSGVQNAIQTVKDVFNAVKTWLNSNIIQPIGSFFSSLWDGFKNGAKNAWQGIKDVFSKVSSFFKDIFTKAWTGVKNVFSVGGKIFSGIKDGIVNAFKSVVNVIIKGLNKVVAIPFNGLNNVLNKISGISILGVSPFSWLTWRAPVPQIPMLASGGILTQPTLNIAGEAGPEAIIPIDKLQYYISSALDKTMQNVNINALAAAIEDLANRPVELNINGKRFAVATASDTDSVNGNRLALMNRGLAL